MDDKASPEQESKFLSRKWIATIISFIVLALLVSYKIIPPTIFENLWWTTLALYMTGNAADKIIEKLKLR